MRTIHCQVAQGKGCGALNLDVGRLKKAQNGIYQFTCGGRIIYVAVRSEKCRRKQHTGLDHL